MSEAHSRPLYERTARAGLWTVGGKLVGKGLDFVSLLVLARFLGPAEFGLVAMAMTAVFIVEAVMDMPLGIVLLNIDEPTDAMFDTAYTLGVLRSLGIFIILAGLSWPLSMVYHEPRLIALMCALSAAPAFRGLGSPRMVLFGKHFDFSRDFILDASGKVASLIIASSIAIVTHSYWAIAAGTISTSVVMMIGSFIFAPHRPRFTLSHWHIFAHMVGWNAASQVVVAINWQIDRLLLPRFIDVATFGRFSSADNLVAIPIQAVVQPVTRPFMSAFAAMRQSDNLGNIYLKASAGVTMIVAPILLALAVLALPIIKVILGHNWLATAPIMHWLALIGILTLPTVVMPALAQTLNRTHMVTARVITELLVKVPAVLIGILILGLNGAILGRAFAAVAILLVTLFIVRNLISLSIADQCKAYARPLLALVPMAAFYYACDVFVLAGDNVVYLLFNLVWVGSVGVAIYGGACLTIWALAGRPDGCEQLAVKFAGRLISKYLPQRVSI